MLYCILGWGTNISASLPQLALQLDLRPPGSGPSWVGAEDRGYGVDPYHPHNTDVHEVLRGGAKPPILPVISHATRGGQANLIGLYQWLRKTTATEDTTATATEPPRYWFSTDPGFLISLLPALRDGDQACSAPHPQRQPGKADPGPLSWAMGSLAETGLLLASLGRMLALSFPRPLYVLFIQFQA